MIEATKWESIELGNMDEVEDGEEDMSTNGNFHPLKCQKTWQIFPGILIPIL